MSSYCGLSKVVRSWLGEKEYRCVAGEIENRRIKMQIERYGLMQHEAVALRHYTGTGYEMLNKHLNGVIYDESLEPIAAILHNALSKLPDYQGVAIRRTRLPDDVLAKHVVGETINYPAFTSATFGKKDVVIGEENDSPHRLLIQSKHAKRIDWISRYQSEVEVLFTAPTSFYVLDRRANSSNGLLEIVLYERND